MRCFEKGDKDDLVRLQGEGGGVAFGTAASSREDVAGSASKLGIPREATAAVRVRCLREEEGMDGPLPGLEAGQREGHGDGPGCRDVAHLGWILGEELRRWEVFLDHGCNSGARGDQHGSRGSPEQRARGGELGGETGGGPLGAKEAAAERETEAVDDARRGGGCGGEDVGAPQQHCYLGS